MARASFETSRSALRRFLIHHLALAAPQQLPDVDAAVERLAFVQQDSIPICGRLHDLLLYARVADYRPSDLEAYLYRDRKGIEHFVPNLAVIPQRHQPFILHFMYAWRTRAEGWGALGSPADQALAREIMAHVRTRGPTSPRHLTQPGHTINPWGARSKHTTLILEKLFVQGRLGIHSRVGFDRVYDLFDRLYSEQTPAPHDEAMRWRARMKLWNQGLVAFKKDEQSWIRRDPLVEIKAEGLPGRYVISEESLPLLEQASALELSDEVQLIAPLDPLIYDRDRTAALFDFDYIWEVYTPAAKRRWGYYVLPLLQGERLVGRVDLKLERKDGILAVRNLLLEPGVSLEVAGPLRRRLEHFASWHGVSVVRLDQVQPLELSRALQDADGAVTITSPGPGANLQTADAP